MASVASSTTSGIRPQELPSVVTTESSALRVLMVAEESTCARLRQVFSGLRQRPVACAETGQWSEAWRALGRGSFDLVLADLALGRGGPLEVLHRLQAVAPQVPVVAMLSRATEEDSAQLLQAGAQDYVVLDDLQADGLARTIRNALDRQHYLSRLRELSYSDALTGLYNRRGFEVLADAQLRLVRRTRKPALLLYVDLDGLKAINDDHGHAVGDRALLGTAEALRVALRRSDLVARLGGDEFVALVFEADACSAEVVKARMRAALSAAAVARELPCPLEVSIGIAPIDPNGDLTLGELLTRADRELYRAKRRVP
ncbi:MAG: GGDEF domain-containing response regulator [Candidatus Eisenbacteria bacterium]|uniref:GGDEF domain-containing response regulator n=1 Tax=Eiseniibacteriota bacterium TaxID=2212470 RepID=A0A849SHG6_UNCEI|nr:GGDEF domain-containing response regulator [Candidatus Eisenbacteria bacterium]